jgi:Tfp pilus assembly protein PilF
VVWVVERKDVLCTCFAALSCVLYGRYRRAPSVGRWLAVTVTLVLALLSKPMAITLPFALLLLDFWPFTAPRAEWKWRALEKLPWVVMGFALAAYTLGIQTRLGAVAVTTPLSERLRNVPVAYALELFHTVWPVRLSFLYPRFTVSTLVFALSSLVLLGLLASAWVVRKRSPSWSVGVLWFCGLMFPTSGIITFGSQLTADRYTYLPHLGLFFGLVFAVPELPARFARAAALSAGALVLACESLLLGQIFVWSDSEALYQQALRRDANSVYPLHLLALLEKQQGRYELAFKLFERALEINPGDAIMRGNYALTLLQVGRSEEALKQAELAHQQRRGDTTVDEDWAQVIAATGRCDGAMEDLEQLCRREPPRPVELYYSACLLQSGQADRAWEVLAHGVERMPADPEIADGAAKIAQRAGRDDLAGKWAAEAQRRSAK